MVGVKSIGAWNAIVHAKSDQELMFLQPSWRSAPASLFRRTARAALAGTIAWGLAVWWLGEGLGGILGSATSSPLTGAPGAAVLYALLVLLALAFWPVRRDSAAPVRDDGFLTG